MPLISVEDYKTFLKKRYQKDEFDNERDIYYSNILIPAGEKAIKEHLQIDFTSATRTAEQHFVLELSTEFLIPDFFPVTAIASITLDGETVDADNYSLLPRDSTIRHRRVFGLPLQNLIKLHTLEAKPLNVEIDGPLQNSLP